MGRMQTWGAAACALWALGMPVWAEPSAAAADAGVMTPAGLARIEGDPFQGGVQRLVVGDRIAMVPEADSAQQRVWIAHDFGDVLLVGLGSIGNGCFDEYVFVHVGAGDDLRSSGRFGTCGGMLTAVRDGKVLVVEMDSPNPNEGRLQYRYTGTAIKERVLGQQESHSPPSASAHNWVGHAPRELFEVADWRGPLVKLIGEAAYHEAQGVMYFYDGPGMVPSEGWVAGLSFGRDADRPGAAVAIHEEDRRLLVVLFREGEPPRLWGDARGPLPAPIVEALRVE